MGQNKRHNMADKTLAPNDDELLKRSRGGDMDAFGLLINKYQDRLFNAMLRMVNNYDDAQELTQDAFVRALQSVDKFRGKSGFYTWLFRIGMNLGINFHRRRTGKVRFVNLQAERPEHLGRQANGLMNLVDQQNPLPVEQAQTREMHRRVLLALQNLEGPARAVVVLRDIEDLDYSDIAEILDLPVGTVKSRLFRARMTLRKMLNEPEGQ